MKENQRKCIKCGRSAEDPNVTLHRFPKPGTTNTLRCELWAKYCFPHDSWFSSEFQNQLYSKHYMLCNKHFKKSSFVDRSEKRLFRSAAPDEECDEITSSQPIIEASNEFELPVAAQSKTRQPFCEISNNTQIEAIDKITSQPIPVLSNVFETTAGPSNIQEPEVLREKLSNVFEPTAGPSNIQESEVLQEKLSNVFEPTAGPSNIQEPEVLQEKQRKQEEKLKCIVKKMKNQIQKIYRLQKTIKNLKNEEFLKVLSKNDLVNKVLNSKISPTFALLMQGQLQNYKRKSKGCR